MLSKNRQPTHPGEILLEEFLKPLKLSQEQFAKHLNGSWKQPKISEIINKKRRITEAIALDFADALGTSSEFWLNLQNRYDLWLLVKITKKSQSLLQEYINPMRRKKRIFSANMRRICLPMRRLTAIVIKKFRQMKDRII